MEEKKNQEVQKHEQNQQQPKKKTIKKPPASMKSETFKAYEDKAVELLGDDYWHWLEKQHKDYILKEFVGIE